MVLINRCILFTSTEIHIHNCSIYITHDCIHVDVQVKRHVYTFDGLTEHTRAVHKLLRQLKLKATWKGYRLDFTILDKSTFFLSICKISIKWLHLANHIGHKKSITWRYAEHSDVANVTSAAYN